MTQSTLSWQQLQGYRLQQLFFNLVETVDPQLGGVLRQDAQNRAYSLSALQLNEASAAPRSLSWLTQKRAAKAQPAQQPSKQVSLSPVNSVKPSQTSPRTLQLQYSHDQPIAANTPCWWRISFLDDDLFDHLIFLWNQLHKKTFSLGCGQVMIHSVAADLPSNGLPTTGFPRLDWAYSCSYRDIYEQADVGDRDIHLQFITPTAFEQAGQVTALPTAEAVFHPLRRHWNCYSGLAFAPRLIDSIIPTHFNIQTQRTQRFRNSSAEPITACLGQISFQIAHGSDPLIIKRINTLADFTRYCPVGCNTQLGMGVIRRLSSPTTRTHQRLPKILMGSDDPKEPVKVEF